MGSISGTVRDSSGAVIAGVTVTLINVDTGITLSTTTGSEGQYTFSPVKIGHYSISATASGFQTVQQNNVTVDVQQKIEVNLSLPVGQTTESIVVNSAPPLLQTLDASVGQVIEEKAINDLPLNGRNFTFLAQLSAGVTQASRTRVASVAPEVSPLTACVPHKTTTFWTGWTTTRTLSISLTGPVIP
jgi:Carboxypeptidase regulatory-like domain